jgi:hypothetical protein
MVFERPLAPATLVVAAALAACQSQAAGPAQPLPRTAGAEVPVVQPRPGAAIDEVLAPQVTPAFQSEVLVLGTTHLAALRAQLRPEHLETLLALLRSYAPTRIAVEALTPDEIALLAERAAHDPAAAELLGMFGGRTLAAGRDVQQLLGVERVAAERAARTLLAEAEGPLPGDRRAHLVQLLLAAYEFDSAVLHWSQLEDATRATGGVLTPELRALLNARLGDVNEIYSLAVPLARTLGLPRIYPIDSQYDGVRILAAPRQELGDLLRDPARGELHDHVRAARSDSIKALALAGGDLLPLYLHANATDHQLGTESQWNWLFRLRHPSGLDRFRYALWDLRNLRQATNVADVAASGAPERVLVLVGAGHKAALDRILATQLSVRLVQLEQILERHR